MSFEALVARLDTAIWRVERGELNRVKDLGPLLTEAEAAASGLDASGVEQLLLRVDRARAVIEAARHKGDDRVHEVRKGRRALRGFATYGQGDRRDPR